MAQQEIPPSSAALTLEQAITEAVRSPTDASYDRVLTLLPGREVYLRLLAPQGGQQTMESVTAGPLRCARLFTTRTHPLLGMPYGGMTWEAAIAMIAKVPAITGMMVVNAANDWVVYGKALLLEAAKGQR